MNISKLFIITILTSFLSIPSYGQSAESKYKASMDGWLVDIDDAQALSTKTGKPILANFTGSDWCGWCIRLKRDVFITDKFKQWAEKNVVLLELDYPRRFKLPENIQQQNAALQKAFSVRGFPTIWVFKMVTDPLTNQKSINGLANTGYIASPEAWIKEMDEQLKKK